MEEELYRLTPDQQRKMQTFLNETHTTIGEVIDALMSRVQKYARANIEMSRLLQGRAVFTKEEMGDFILKCSRVEQIPPSFRTVWIIDQELVKQNLDLIFKKVPPRDPANDEPLEKSVEVQDNRLKAYCPKCASQQTIEFDVIDYETRMVRLKCLGCGATDNLVQGSGVVGYFGVKFE